MVRVFRWNLRRVSAGNREIGKLHDLWDRIEPSSKKKKVITAYALLFFTLANTTYFALGSGKILLSFSGGRGEATTKLSISLNSTSQAQRAKKPSSKDHGARSNLKKLWAQRFKVQGGIVRGLAEHPYSSKFGQFDLHK